MKVSELIAILQEMPQDIEIIVNDNAGGEVYSINDADDITHYVPNTDLWPDDVPQVVIQVNT